MPRQSLLARTLCSMHLGEIRRLGETLRPRVSQNLRCAMVCDSQTSLQLEWCYESRNTYQVTMDQTLSHFREVECYLSAMRDFPANTKKMAPVV